MICNFHFCNMNGVYYYVTNTIFTARSSYASAVLGIVILSVRLSVTRVLFDEMQEQTAEILTPHERVTNLVFCYQKSLVGDDPFHLKFAIKVTHPPLKSADFDQYLLITSHQELAKKVQLSQIGSRPRAFQRAR